MAGLEAGLNVTRAEIGNERISFTDRYGNSSYVLVSEANRNTLRKACDMAFRDSSLNWKYVSDADMRIALMSGYVPETAKQQRQYGSRMATDKQKWSLVHKYGYEQYSVDRMTFGEASKAIQEAIDKAENRNGWGIPKSEPIQPEYKSPQPVPSGDFSKVGKAIEDLTEAVTINALATSKDLTDIKARLSAVENDLETVKNLQPKVIQLHFTDREAIEVTERQHECFEDVLAIIQARKNLFLVGPPGTGKSTIAIEAAEVLGLEHSDISFGPTTPESRLMGYYDANGKYVRTPFRDRFEFGGVFCGDELDNGHPGIVTILNTALANHHCTFPDGKVAKHPDFVFVATANTNGLGPTRQFVGRNQLDAATLDRFNEIEVGYDEVLEEEIVRSHWDDPKAIEWLSLVRKYRRNASDAGLMTFFTPRASIDGVDLLRDGMEWATAVKVRLEKSLPQDVLAKVRGE